MSSRYRNAVRVSHIGASENLDSDTQIGTIIVNFLVGSKVDPNANVAIIVDTPRGRILKSLYDFDLYNSILTLPGAPDVILTSVNFDDDAAKMTSLMSLIEYLEGVSNKSYDDNNIYEKARIELQRLSGAREKITKTVRFGVRDNYVPDEEIVTQRVVLDGVSRNGLYNNHDNNPGVYSPADTQNSMSFNGLRRFGNNGSMRGSGY